MILYPQRQKEEKLSVSVRGIGNALKSIVNPIPYRIVCESADWTPYFGTTFDNWQKFGQWDTNDCWEYSPTKQIEMQLNALWVRGEFSTEAKNFFVNNGIVHPMVYLQSLTNSMMCFQGIMEMAEQRRSTHNSFRSMESFPKRL